jgi:adenosine deaminase
MNLPKAELDCHLDGFVHPSTVISLAQGQGITIPMFDESELCGLLVCPLDCLDLVTYLQCFDIVLNVMQHSYAITPMLSFVWLRLCTPKTITIILRFLKEPSKIVFLQNSDYQSLLAPSAVQCGI